MNTEGAADVSGQATTHDDIIQANTRRLAELVGGQAKFADKVDLTDSQVSQLIGKNPIKNIGRQLARKIEAAFDKPVGWLDQPHDLLKPAGAAAGLETAALRIELTALANRAAQAAACLRAALAAPESDRDRLRALALQLLEKHRNPS